MKKRIFILILCCIFLSGCWDRRELDQIGITVGVALDKDFITNKIIVTCEVIRSSNLKKVDQILLQPLNMYHLRVLQFWRL